jgi:DhnA family fructose-bisphosphate aldolase class Ia
MLSNGGKLLQTESTNAVIVAMDHGVLLGAREGFVNPRTTLDRVLNGKPDGVLVGASFAQRFQEELRSVPKLTITIAGDLLVSSVIPGEYGSLEHQFQLHQVSELAQLRADAIKLLLIFGKQDGSILANNMRYIAHVAEEARHYDIPVVVEPLLQGTRIDESQQLDPMLIQHACRIAFELGANVLKAPYPGDQKAFSKIVENSPIPILILGGPAKTVRDVLRMVKEATDAGGKGVFFGRNIWGYPHPDKMISAIKAIVHHNSSVDEAMMMLSEHSNDDKALGC